MKTEVKKKVTLNAVPEAALEEAGLAKETILAAIPMDGVVLVTKDSMPIVELLQMLDRLNLYAAEMLTALHQNSVQVAAIPLLTVMLGIILMMVGIPLIKQVM